MPSSVVKYFYYEKNSRDLVVVFVSGMVYKYKNVPEKIFNKMKQAFSKGVFLNRFIKGRYNFEKVN